MTTSPTAYSNRTLRSRGRLAALALALGLALVGSSAGCSTASNNDDGTGGVGVGGNPPGSGGGVIGSGGAVFGSGGAIIGSGGVVGSGGAIGSGGAVGSGGVVGVGGDAGSGGAQGSGGDLGSGGAASGGASGSGGAASGGAAGTGGAGTGGAGTGGAGTGGAGTGGGGTGGAGTGGAGTGGAGTGGAGTGGAGTGGAGTGGSTACPGCAVLFVPFETTNEQTEFEISFGGPVDFTDTTVVARVQVELEGDMGGIRLYVKEVDGDYTSVYTDWTNFTDATADFVELTITPADLAAETDIDPTQIQWVGINMHSGGVAGTFGDTYAYIDSITFDTTTPADFTFDDDQEGMGLNGGITNVSGSDVSWEGP